MPPGRRRSACFFVPEPVPAQPRPQLRRLVHLETALLGQTFHDRSAADCRVGRSELGEPPGVLVEYRAARHSRARFELAARLEPFEPTPGGGRVI